MSTLDLSVTNDGCWFEGNGEFKNNDIVILAGYYNGTRKKSNSYLRFTNVEIPKGKRINEAYLTITCNYSHTQNTVNSKICAVDADNPAAPTNYSEAENATRTTASVAWNAITEWTAEGEYISPNIAPVIQEIIDRDGWVSGNSILLYWEDDGTTTINSTVREGYSLDSNPDKRAVLRIVSSAMNMVTLDREIMAESDDGAWFEGSGLFQNDIAFVLAGYHDSGPVNSFMRFTNINIPRGKNIVEAHITFTASNNYSLGAVNTNICAIDSDNAIAPTSYAEAEGATRTTAVVAWDAIPAWVKGTEYRSPNIASIIQEIIDRPDWVSGNSIVIYWENDGSTAVGGTLRPARSRDLTSDSPPVLQIVSSNPFSESLLPHPHTSKWYMAVKTPRIIWKGRVLDDRGYNQDGDVEADLQININTELPYGNETGFDIANFLPDLTAWVGTTDGGYEHGKCRIRSFSGNNLVVSADMTCSWKIGDFVSITDVHELWPMPHVVTESDGEITILKDHDLDAATYKGEFPVAIMGSSACAFIDPVTGKATVEFYGADSYLVEPNSDENHWTYPNGIQQYSWWFEGADTTTSAEANPTATYSTAGQYVVSLELYGENGTVFKSFRNVFIFDRTGANAPITDFIIESMSGSLENHGWEAIIEVFGDTFNPTNLPDEAEVVLFAENRFAGEAEQYGVGLASLHRRDNIMLVGYASDTSLSYESGKIRSAKMSIYGLQRLLKGKTNFSVYVSQIEDFAPEWSRFANGLTTRMALYYLVRWHWTLLRFADFRIPDDHNNYFPGQNFPEGSLFSQLDSFCPAIQADWAVDKNGALVIFSRPNYLPISGDGAVWRTRLYTDVFFTDADIEKLEVEHRVSEEVSRVRVEGVFATATNYWTSTDTAPGDIRNYGGATVRVEGQILGSGGFVGSQGEELARMIYAEKSRKYERIIARMCGNYSFMDIVPTANYFELSATPATLRGLAWRAKPFWATAISLEIDHINGDVRTTITAIPETRPDANLVIYSQYDEIGESVSTMPTTGEYGMADLLQEMDDQGPIIVPALMGDGGGLIEGSRPGTSFVRLWGDMRQTVVAENRLLHNIADRPVRVEITRADGGGLEYRVISPSIANDVNANATYEQALVAHTASLVVPGNVVIHAQPVPILVLGTYMPKILVVSFEGIVMTRGSVPEIWLYKNGDVINNLAVNKEGKLVAHALSVECVAGDYLAVEVHDNGPAAADLLVQVVYLVYGI